ncbi:MAG: M1 family metallopeptidase, partial [Deltaproteobacteria bacterium]
MPARKKRATRRARSARGTRSRPGRKAAPRTKAARRKKAARPAGPRGFRLPSGVVPRAYDLWVDVDPRDGDRYRGAVSIEFSTDRARRTIELHASEIRATRARVECGGRTRRGRVVPNPARETIAVELAEPVPAGDATVHIDFSGRLRRDLRGLYAAASGERRYAFTQLEAPDARRFFPCFDEPDKKARFRVSVTTGAPNEVISNAPIDGIEHHPGGRKTVRFRPTPPLPTYLLALAVGDLEPSAPVYCGDTEIRVWHVPGKGQLTAFALEAARECLARLEQYFDLPYPYEKLDLVAVPDFEAGAMENAGAVFFRETLLLVDAATISLVEQKRVAEVICHELAHMWYGDLVTMAWWNDLWLNEAFATWMAFAIVDAWRPEWKMWREFNHHRAAALNLDALDTTHPVYTEVKTPDEATQNFDLITYEKGASVVRMVERYLGPEAFRDGVRRYIRRHRESNAVAADLWRALAEASGQEVEPIVRAWIEQPGFPLLAVRRVERNGRAQLELRQERFRIAAPRSGPKPAAARWPIPWVGRLGEAGSAETRLSRRLLQRARETMDLPEPPPRFVYANADESGFFRPLHDAALLGAITENLPALSPVERMGLVNHQWALVRAARAPIDSFLGLASALGEDDDPDVLAALRPPLAFALEQLIPELGDEARERYRSWIVGRFGEAFVALGWDPAPGEDDDTRMRRAALVGLLGAVAEWEPVVQTANRRLDAYLADRTSLDANLADAVVAIGARGGDAARFDALLEASRRALTPQEARRLLLALGEFRADALIDRALALSLTDAVPTQEVVFLLVRLLQNRCARERTWQFLKRRWPRLHKRMPPMLVSRPIEALPELQTAAHRRDVASFFRAHPVPAAARAVRQAL